MKPYKASQKIGNRALPWLAFSSTIGGAAIGGAVWAVSLLFYLIILFPLAMGFAGYLAIAFGVHKGKVRNSTIAALFGALTGFVLYGTVHLGDYLYFKRVASGQIEAEYGQQDPSTLNGIINGYLQEETGATGFWGFMKLNAKTGVSIGQVGSGSGGLNLGETGTWAYWVIELLVIEVMVLLGAASQAQKPFSEENDRWYGEKEAIGMVGSAAASSFLENLNGDRYSAAGQQFAAANAGVSEGDLLVYVQRCPGSNSADLFLTASQVSFDNKGKVQQKDLLEGMVSVSHFKQFQEAIVEAHSQQQTTDATADLDAKEDLEES